MENSNSSSKSVLTAYFFHGHATEAICCFKGLISTDLNFRRLAFGIMELNNFQKKAERMRNWSRFRGELVPHGAASDKARAEWFHESAIKIRADVGVGSPLDRFIVENTVAELSS
jgi:hypothetical protein